MSEPRKNHLSIDGGQVKDDDHVASYKPIPDAESEFRSSKSNLSKSKEKVSVDGAEEKLLPKEEEAKIVTRVDMADAKYVVGDHRNGDAKIELDANKRQFSGLTKDELLKYADDPFWVRLRWFLFILFWGMWACMLAGAIVIIVQAPKCAPPTPRTWFEKGPLVDTEEMSVEDIEKALPQIQKSKVEGIFVDAPTYEVLDEPSLMDKFKMLFTKAKENGIKVVVDLVPNYVSTDHKWFKLSENRTDPYKDYFVWSNGNDYNNSRPNPPNKWVSTFNASAWTWSDIRGEHYLHQYAETQADLNFWNPSVLEHLDALLTAWIQAGASGVRLVNARQMIVNSSLPDELPAPGTVALGADHKDYAFWQHQHTSDQPELFSLLERAALTVSTAAQAQGLTNSVFTIKEEKRPELSFRFSNVTVLRPRSAAPIQVADDVVALAADINRALEFWPFLQLKSSPEDDRELSALAMLLPAAPVLMMHQLSEDNTTANQALAHLVKLRSVDSLEHGFHEVKAIPPRNSTDKKLLACVRWKPGHEGYAAVLNPGTLELRANLTGLPSVPDTLTLKHISHAVSLYHNYTNSLPAGDVLVPPKSTVLLSYVPLTAAEH